MRRCHHQLGAGRVGRPRRVGRGLRSAARIEPRRRADPPRTPSSRIRRRSTRTPAQDSQSTAVLRAAPSRPRLYRQGPERRSRRWPSPGKSRTTRRPSRSTFATRSTAMATRSSPATSSTAGSAWSTRGPRRRIPTSWPRSRAARSCSAWPARIPPRAMPTSTPRSTNFGVEAPDDKTFIVHLTTPGDLLPERRVTLWVAVPIQESVDHQRRRHRGRQLRQLRPVHARRPGTTTARSSSSRTRTGTASKPTLTEIQMPIFAEPADAQAAYEAGEIDAVCPSRPRTSSGSRTDPVLGDRVLGDRHARRSPTTTSTTAPILRRRHQARCEDPKACPTDEQELPDRADRGDRQAGVHRRHVRRDRPGRQQLRRCRASRATTRRSTRIRSISTSAKAHMATALQELGFASAADIPPLKFGFNTGAGHEPRVAFLAEAWRQAFGLETEQIGSDFSVFLTAADRRRLRHRPQRAGVPTTRTRTTSSMACSPAVAATTTASTATRSSTR